ncbi:hypothetical protein K435DRAFT_866857 [Dendrothele bispora CBS 962.96]|uniref:Uncharacterized protein n=1 Tax=Dendrothele bispora (strain CBS 962.96) TaxID=1314807 RepID=A0A4S8LH33_DENBC|nr:hypothetical protein K435DRAFT_866857 [Dendrothele bispora CBS 962.96]
MPPVRNQRLRHRQQAIRIPVRDLHEGRDVEMAQIPLREVQNANGDVIMPDPQHHNMLRAIVLIFMDLMNLRDVSAMVRPRLFFLALTFYD